MHGIAVHSASLGKMEWDDGGKMAAENSISFYVFYRWRYAFGLKINIDILCMIFNSTSLYLLCVCVYDMNDTILELDWLAVLWNCIC